jgi:signal transduction histidine kinase
VGVESTVTVPSRWTVVILVFGAFLSATVLIWLASTNESLNRPGLQAGLACWITVPYIVAGLIAWRRRPESRLGALMVTAGFATFINFLIWSDNDLLFTLGVAGQFLPPVLFLHVFLSFPSGRLESRPDRVVVAAAYVAAGLTVLALALGEEAPRNVLAVVDASRLAEAIQGLQLLMVSVLSLTGVALLIRRRLRSGRPMRASLGLLVDSFSLILVMIALLLLAGLLGWTTVQGPIRLATFAAVGVAPIVFLIGLLQAQLGRGSVAKLMVDLGVNPGPVELQDAVARALRDPSVRLAYWLPEFGSYADVDGREISLELEQGRSATPIMRDGLPVATLLHNSALSAEPLLLSSVVAAAGMAIHNARLQVELRARLEELRGSRARILHAEQRERRRLERDLHDGAQHRLVGVSLELGELRDRVSEDPELAARVDEARQEVAASLAELRDLAHGIHPATVSDHGLGVALESLTTRATVPVHLHAELHDRLPEPVELAAFYLVSEALANITKHARASSGTVELTREEERLVVEVMDDGVGGATTERGTGLRGLADRIEALGGRLQVWSPPGKGTRLRAEIPCA